MNRFEELQRLVQDRPVNVTVFLDDVCPVNLMKWHDPQYEHIPEYPTSFHQKVLSDFGLLGLKGKVSVTPLPGINTQAELDSSKIDLFLSYRPVYEKFAQLGWEFSLEGITHHRTLELPEKFREDEFFDSSSPGEIQYYLSLGQRLCKTLYPSVVLSSITSPWGAGERNLKAYEEGILKFFEDYWRSEKIEPPKTCWYFLFISNGKEFIRPKRISISPSFKVPFFHFPALIEDFWWECQFNPEVTEDIQGRAFQKLIQVVKELKRKSPQELNLSVLTHWQSLFSNGTLKGLQEFEKFLHSLREVVGTVNFVAPNQILNYEIEKSKSR